MKGPNRQVEDLPRIGVTELLRQSHGTSTEATAESSYA